MGLNIKRLFSKGRRKKSEKHADDPNPDIPNAGATPLEADASLVNEDATPAIRGPQNETQPTSQDLWQAAYAQLDSNDQRKLTLLDEPSENRSISRESHMASIANTVIKTTETRYDEYQRKGLRIKRSKGDNINIRDSALKIVSATLSFNDLISAVATCDPTGCAAKVWGLVSVGLNMIQNHQDLQASIFQASEFLTDVLSRCAFVETRCLRSSSSDIKTQEMLRNAIVRVYTAVLRYSASVVSIQQSGAVKRACLSVTALTDQPLSALKTAIREEEGQLEKWIQFDQQLLWEEKAEQMLSGVDNVLSGIQDISREMELCKLTIAEGAAFDSYINQHEPECLPGTRTDLIKQITEWSDSTQGECIFWLNGMAGTGKSTVSRTVCNIFQQKGLLGASFFFKRGKADCGKAEKFFPTIVRQLVIQEPRLIPSIRRAIQRDPSISTKSLGEQFNKLLLEPLLTVKDHSATSSIVIVVDALDECEPEIDVELLLRLLPLFSTSSSIRVRVFLTSRPEIPIRQGFDSVSRNDHLNFSIHEIVESSVKHDILLFMNAKFEEMRRKRSLPHEWPGDKMIEDLVNMATPLFISAATMCRFIADRRWDPGKRLALVLGMGGAENASGSHISKLEHTYIPVFEQILRSGDGDDGDDDEDEREQLIHEYRVLVGTIIILANPLALRSLAKLLDIPSSDVSRRLDYLHSVLSIPDDQDVPIQIFHLSFRDFLLHPKVRSKTDFWIDEKHIHKETLLRCISVMTREKGGLSRNICQLSSDGTLRSEVTDEDIRKHIPAELQYSCHYWIYHLQQGDYRIADQDRIHNFLETHFLHWLEAMSILGLAQKTVSGIKTLQSSVQPGSGYIVSKFLHDANRFILKNIWIADTAPLQFYSAALIFAPRDSIVRNVFKSQIPRRLVTLPRVEETWDAQLLTLDHTRRVIVVAFSPDGKVVASGPFNDAVHLWDPATGILLHILEQAVDVRALAFSPDSKQLASSSWDETIQLWDIATGALQGTFTENTDTGGTLTFLPDKRLLASGYDDGTVKLWDLTTGTINMTMSGHSQDVRSVAVSPNGKLMASGSRDRTAKLWNLATGGCLQELEHNGTVTSVGFSPDSELVATGSLDGTTGIWDATTGELKRALDSGSVDSLAFSPDGQQLATAGSGHLQLWDTTTGELLHRIEGHTRAVSGVAFSPISELLASCSDDGTIRLWDTTLVAAQNILHRHSSAVAATKLSPDGKLLGSASSDYKILLWDAVTGTPLHTLEGYSGKSSTFSFSPDGELVAFRPKLSSTSIQLWNSASGQLYRTLEDHSDAVDRVIFSPTSRQLATVEEGGTINVWDIHTGERIYVMASSGSWVCVAFSQSGAKLATGSHDAVRVWDASTGVIQHELKGHGNIITAVAFSLDERHIASGSNDAKLCLWDLAKGELSQTLQDSGAINQLVFSTDGRLVASGTLSQTFRLWDRETGDSLYGSNNCASHYRDGITNLRFSSDNTYLEADFGRLRIPCNENTNSISNRRQDVILGEQWLHIREERVLWLPVEYRPKVSAYYNGTFAIGSESGLVSFITIDMDRDANDHS